jgi:hypothetical protein
MTTHTGDTPWGASLGCPWRGEMVCMILGFGSGRLLCRDSTNFCQRMWPVWLRRLSQSRHARSVCAQTTASILTLPRIP